MKKKRIKEKNNITENKRHRNNRVEVDRVISILNSLAPFSWSAEWDNSGFLVGNRRANISAILLTVDTSPSVIEEAVAKGAGLIVSHHPPFLRLPKCLDSSTYAGKVISMLVEGKISLIAYHTPLDMSDLGTSMSLAFEVGLVEVRNSGQEIAEHRYKIVTYLPEKDARILFEKLEKAGAGKFSENYRGCWFSSNGKGRFIAGPETNPTAGIRGSFNEIEETRLETFVSERDLEQVLSILEEHHPYEEPVIDVYRLERPSRRGYLVTGMLEETLPVRLFAEKVKKSLPGSIVTLCGNTGRKCEIKKVAVVAGSGMEFYDRAVRSGADLFLTGEINHHQALQTDVLEIPVLCVGHWESERPALKRLKQYLDDKLPGIEVIISECDRSPFVML